uniref:C2H2-type domain-containing protein n=1 Tax=Clastoptera arizonana TaxID=38151 RepID=A0A1B6CYR8_9HEMI
MVIRNKYVRPVGIQNIVENQTLEQQLNVIPDEITNVNKTDVMNLDEEIDSDYDVEIRSSRRSLPHKKRIPKKLKAPPARNIHAKCYKCNKCGESFTSQAAFTTHRATHSVPTKRLPATTTFSCELCNKLFSSQIKFFEHLKSHYEPLQPAQLTPLESSPSVISLHNVDPSPTIEDTFTLKTEVLPSQEIKEEVVSTSTLPCPQCGKHFRRQKALETHVSITHSTQEHIEEFSEPEDMMEGIRHVVNIQGADSGEEDNCEDKMRQWKYGEVQEMGMNLQEMCLGLAASESDSEKTKSRRNKQLSCTVCNRSFNHRNSLLYHVRSHSGQRPHQCDVCGKSFFASSALKVHMRLHSGDKPYKCEFCGRNFRQWGDLKYHVTSLHSEQKQFQCEYCGKDFARKYSLIVHRRIHTGEKNYHCEFCNKTFRASSYLQNHRRIHTGEKPHPCDVCGKPFRVRSDMKRHRNTHTGERGARRTINSAEPPSDGEEEITHSNNDAETIIPDTSPLNLNVRNGDPDDGMTYTRGEAIARDGNTLFVWIPTQNGALLSDE